ncbi:MAG: glycosyltransferase 87 family protein, partial [Acidimicrobiales bacterium]
MFLVAATAGVALSADVASGRPILGARWGLLVRLAVWGLAWVVAAWSACRLPKRVALAAVIAAAVALRLAALAGPPTTSDDLYRYAWDGRVQHAGIDPYASPPASPALVRLHDPWLWPDATGCSALHRPAGCTRINRPTVRTIYPPVAEAWFAALGGLGGRHKTWQVAGLVVDMATIGLLYAAIRRRGGDVRMVAWYALSPIPVLELVNNAHVDGLAIALAVAAFLVLAGRRVDAETGDGAGAGAVWRDVAFGALIGAAALVKVYPALLLL